MSQVIRSQVIYTGGFRFPEGDAAAARVLGIGKALRDANYEVRFAGGEEGGRPEDCQADGSYSYQGFRYFSTGEIRTQPASLWERLLHYTSMGEKTLTHLGSLNPATIRAVIMYQPLTASLLRVERFCRVNGVAVVVDATEWHDPGHYPGGRFGLHRWDVDLSMRYLNRRAGNLIAISTFLERFYRDRGVHTLRVPPLVDLSDAKWAAKRTRPWTESPLRLIYAGSPGKKDLLGRIIAAVRALRREGEAVVLELVGPTAADAASWWPDRGAAAESDALVFHGPVGQSHVPDFLVGAHCAVLLRPKERFAQAGFPTKVVEALAAGLPLITNVTSDIGQYVRDGVEGFLVEDCSEQAVAMGIRRALGAGPSKLREMGAACRRQAEVSFDYRNYVSDLSAFFSNLLPCQVLLPS